MIANTKNRIIAALGAMVIASWSGASLSDECTPSKWGADDQLGAANYLTPERVLLATKLVKKGESHGLGIVIDPNMPAYPPRYTQLQVVQPGQQLGFDTKKSYGWGRPTTMISCKCGSALAHNWMVLGLSLIHI